MRIGFVFFFAVTFFAFSAFAAPSGNPADEIDRQRNFVDQAIGEIERQRFARDAEKKAETDRRLRLAKKRDEARLAEQLKGLSGTLSGLPEIPSFHGKFEILEVPAGLDSESK